MPPGNAALSSPGTPRVWSSGTRISRPFREMRLPPVGIEASHRTMKRRPVELERPTSRCGIASAATPDSRRRERSARSCGARVPRAARHRAGRGEPRQGYATGRTGHPGVLPPRASGVVPQVVRRRQDLQGDRRARRPQSRAGSAAAALARTRAQREAHFCKPRDERLGDIRRATRKPAVRAGFRRFLATAWIAARPALRHEPDMRH